MYALPLPCGSQVREQSLPAEAVRSDDLGLDTGALGAAPQANDEATTKVAANTVSHDRNAPIMQPPCARDGPMG
jgi:hypothetical protein